MYAMIFNKLKAYFTAWGVHFYISQPKKFLSFSFNRVWLTELSILFFPKLFKKKIATFPEKQPAKLSEIFCFLKKSIYFMILGVFFLAILPNFRI